MSNWQSTMIEDVLAAVAEDEFWSTHFRRILFDDACPVGLHLAIFVEPYLQLILEGKKTIESRFGAHRRAPFRQVASGDVVLLKRSGGPIVGICYIADVWFYNLDPSSWSNLRSEFTDALCAQDPEFWKAREEASFATLMQLSTVTPLEPVTISKTDRRGWVVLRSTLSSSNTRGLFQ